MHTNDVHSCCYPAEPAAIPDVVDFIETLARGGDFDPASSMKLQLAVEEIILYIGATAPGEMLTFRVAIFGDHMALHVEIAARAIDVRIFNLTWHMDVTSEEGLDSMGLVMASRYVDRFAFFQTENGMLSFRFTVNRHFPDSIPPEPRPTPFTYWRLTRPTGEHMAACHALAREYLTVFRDIPPEINAEQLKSLCRYNELSGSLALSDQNEVVGCVLCTQAHDGIVHFFGPFVSRDCAREERTRMAVSLTEYALEQMARQNIPGMYCIFNDPECFPAHYFTRVGQLGLFFADGIRHEVPTYYFPLRDDAGSVLYVHPQVRAYVQEQVDRQYLSRQMIDACPLETEVCTREQYTVLGVDLNQNAATAWINLLVYGPDAGQVLDAHLKLFARDGLETIFFAADLSLPSHALILPFLLERGFTTKVFVPFGGRGGDLLILQRTQEITPGDAS